MTARSRIAGCGERGHVGATYNPWLDRTWCLCGEVIRDGDVATHDDCCADIQREREPVIKSWSALSIEAARWTYFPASRLVAE